MSGAKSRAGKRGVASVLSSPLPFGRIRQRPARAVRWASSCLQGAAPNRAFLLEGSYIEILSTGALNIPKGVSGPHAFFNRPLSALREVSSAPQTLRCAQSSQDISWLSLDSARQGVVHCQQTPFRQGRRQHLGWIYSFKHFQTKFPEGGN